jgi:hypothetical protein
MGMPEARTLPDFISARRVPRLQGHDSFGIDNVRAAY